jgi:hypothetical protein
MGVFDVTAYVLGVGHCSIFASFLAVCLASRLIILTLIVEGHREYSHSILWSGCGYGFRYGRFCSCACWNNCFKCGSFDRDFVGFRFAGGIAYLLYLFEGLEHRLRRFRRCVCGWNLSWGVGGGVLVKIILSVISARWWGVGVSRWARRISDGNGSFD